MTDHAANSEQVSDTCSNSAEIEHFTFGAYARDRWVSILLWMICAAGAALMLTTLGLNFAAVVVVVGFVLLLFAVDFGGGDARRVAFWRQLTSATEAAQRMSEIPRMIDEPDSFLEGRIALRALERADMLANAEITAARQHADDYRSYIELWIHETKTPIAAAHLIAQRLGGEEAGDIARELESIDRQVEQALYFARSGSVVNDYDIREVDLLGACREACKRNARFLIEQGATPSFDIPAETQVLTDKPWLLFMLGQVIVNAAQYGATSIAFTAEEKETGTPREHTDLRVTDNGAGIAAADMQRVFDRGFTGNNGRARGKATGMGLYLVATMCASLGIGLSLTSEEGTGTTVTFGFPHDRRRV